MTSNVVLFGWSRPIAGREKMSSEHFNDFVQYLGTAQQRGAIDSFDVVLLEPHGGDLNGFFLIKAATAKLEAMMSSQDWMRHMTRASMHLDGVGAVRGATGDAIAGQMALWRELIP